MAEYKVRIWRRTAPLLGNPMKIKRLERDNITVEATDEDAALCQVARAEYEEGGRRLRVYVEVDSANGGTRGWGDYALMDVRDEERRREDEEAVKEWAAKYATYEDLEDGEG